MRFNSSQINLAFTAEGLPVIDSDDELTAGDFFAGGGGITEALYKMPGVRLLWILNHDKIAVKTNIFHHQGIDHYWANVYAQDEHELPPVDFFWASFECDDHTPCRGGGPIILGRYMMGWELYRYAKHLKSLVIGIENVEHIKNWAPIGLDGKPDKTRKGEEFLKWKAAMMSLGYNYVESIRNAADDGLPTRRTRYFAYFYRDGINVEFPAHTHSETAADGLLPWEPCGPYIDLDNHGESIFGRAENPNIPKQHQKPFVDNSIQRIFGAIHRHAPAFGANLNERFQFVVQYYGNHQSQSLAAPLNTVRTKHCHQLITIEKLKFLQGYYEFCQSQNEKWKNSNHDEDFEEALGHFITHYYNSNGNPGANTQSLLMPLNSQTTGQKAQFITHYYNSSGRPYTQHQSLAAPLNTITTNPHKKQLVTILDGFDVKARFLDREELSEISTFPRDYFSVPELNLSDADAFRMIGNAVPPKWGKILISPVVKSILTYKRQNSKNYEINELLHHPGMDGK